MFNKRGKLIFSILMISVLFTSFASASVFSDFWNKLTGNAMVGSVCGNNIVEAGEQCDGNDYPNDKLACNDWSTTHRIGRVYCSSTCTIDTSKCIYSGDIVTTTTTPTITTPTTTNTTNTPTTTNTTTPTSTPTTTNTTNTPTTTNTTTPTSTPTNTSESNLSKEISLCGNNNLDKTENCDGTLFYNSQTSCEYWNDGYAETSGSVTCTSDCRINLTACSNPCGNGVIDVGEQCDGTKFRNDEKRCGFWNGDSVETDGLVSCNISTCKVDFATCTAPSCEVGGKFCSSNSECCSGICRPRFIFLFLLKKCTDPLPNCGNGQIDAGEQCDGALLNGNTCVGLGYDTGTLSCNNQCKFTGCRNVRERIKPSPVKKDDTLVYAVDDINQDGVSDIPSQPESSTPSEKSFYEADYEYSMAYGSS